MSAHRGRSAPSARGEGWVQRLRKGKAARPPLPSHIGHSCIPLSVKYLPLNSTPRHKHINDPPFLSLPSSPPLSPKTDFLPIAFSTSSYPITSLDLSSVGRRRGEGLREISCRAAPRSPRKLGNLMPGNEKLFERRKKKLAGLALEHDVSERHDAPDMRRIAGSRINVVEALSAQVRVAYRRPEARGRLRMPRAEYGVRCALCSRRPRGKRKTASRGGAPDGLRTPSCGRTDADMEARHSESVDGRTSR